MKKGKIGRQRVATSTRRAVHLHRKGLPRSALVGLADDRIAEAKLLASKNYWTGAAYLIGYGAELLLKAVIAKRKNAEYWPYEDILDIAKTHSLDQLLEVAGLSDTMRVAGQTNRILLNNWRIVRTWRVHFRYRNLKRQEAYDIVNAMTEERDGVAFWLRAWTE